jgi:DNA end-binding protein Ku
MRPYWSGQVQISLVSFGVQLIPATEAKSEIRFHEVSRKSGERVRHQKIAESDAEPIEKDDIIKGYEYRKGEYVYVEPEEIAHLRVASRHTFEVEQFIGMDELNPSLLEKPYFVVPENEAQSQAFAVVRKALQQTGKVGIGRIAASGRERLIALSAPADDKLLGMMAYTLRYPAELRRASEYFSDIKKTTVDADQLSLAKELIKRKTAAFDPAKFEDKYEVALHKLIDAKLKNVPLPKEEKPARGAKVIDLMDALRRSVNSPAPKKPVGRAVTGAQHESKPGPRLVKSGSKTASTRRKSA